MSSDGLYATIGIIIMLFVGFFVFKKITGCLVKSLIMIVLAVVLAVVYFTCVA